MKNDTILSKLDYTLIFIVFLLFCASLLAIHSAPLTPDLKGSHFVLRQFIWYIIGSLVAIGVFVMDYDRLKALSWIFYYILLVLLLGLLAAKHGVPVPFAHESHGAFSWYQLPAIGQIQPSEFMKITLILLIGRLIVEHHEKWLAKTIQDDFRLLGKIILVSIVPLGLVLLQPDLGTALVIMAIIASMVLVSGIRWRLIAGLFLATVLGILLLVVSYFYVPSVVNIVLQKHQLDRFYGWLAPYKYSNNEGFQLINSLNAVGSGKLYGVGVGNQNVFLPESYNDFVFSVVCNAFGFVGAAILIALFFLLIYRIIYSAIRTHDPYGSYVCTGITGMLTFTIFQNIGMTIQVMPITGIPLPFISYGGSSLLSNMIAIGLVLSIQARTRKYMFG
ncbi:MAG: FtsW/RodA/SpoVE family cell cycle protein [Heyndrickxia sp.]